MALTGRTGLLALLGALLVGFAVPGWLGIAVVEGLLVAGVVADLTLAGPVRQLQLRRSGDTSVRLGEMAAVTLLVANPGARPVRGWLRDAWPPSAGAVTQRHRVDVGAREQRRLTT